MKKHIGYYISFFLILLSGMFLVFQSQGNKTLVMQFVGLLSFFYILWGLLHHVVHHSVSLRIVIEYFVVALLGIAVIFFVLNGGI